VTLPERASGEDLLNNSFFGRYNQGGRLIKTCRGITSIAPAIGAAAVGVTCAGFVSAQDAWPTVPDETMTSLEGSIGSRSVPYYVSNDGTVIVGTADNDGGGPLRAALWVDGSTTATDLGTLGGADSIAYSVSDDGGVIVGYASNADNVPRAVSWVDGSTTAKDLGTLGGTYSQASRVSADGSVIVGEATNADNVTHAASWVDGSTTATDLGTLGGTFSYAASVSADGGVIVGVSTDADGNYRSFIYKMQMQDLSNLMLSFPTMANDTQIAVAELEYSTGRLMGTTCLADAGSACLRVDSSLSNTGATDSDNIEARSNQSLSLTYGRGLNAQTTLGGTLSITPSGSDNNGFDMGRTVGLSLWGAYSESGQLGTGWQASASVGRNTGTADISRGRSLENVIVSTGSADVTTNSMQATLGYGVQQQDWLFTPSATLTRYTTTRDAYSESGGDFNAVYDSLSVSSTTLDLQLAADYRVSDTGTLMLEAGMVMDLNVGAITLTGTSDMPGMTAVSMDGGLERNETRGFASIGYRHELNDSSSITGALRAVQSVLGNQLQVNVGVGFAMEF
jgi:probable HAF family extracellular repeat protein